MKKMMAGLCALVLGLFCTPQTLVWDPQNPASDDVQTYFSCLSILLGLIMIGSGIADIIVEAAE